MDLHESKWNMEQKQNSVKKFLAQIELRTMKHEEY